MSSPTPLGGPRLSQSVRRRLELTAAGAWEALVKTHVRHALQLVPLVEDDLTYDEVIERYVREMGLTGAMGAAVRNRVLVSLEGVPESEFIGAATAHAAEIGAERSPIRRFRSMVRGLRDRLRRNDEVEGVLGLAFARAEEGVMDTHQRHAVAFAELLADYLPPPRAIREYADAVGLEGCRARSVSQRAMARLAELHLPDPDHDGIPGHVPGGV